MPRKKKIIKKEPTGPQEYEGYKVGDHVYCYREPDDKLSRGRITNIHLTDTSGLPCFTFCCDLVGQFRLALFSKIIDDPGAKIKSSVETKIRRGKKKK